MCVCVYVYAYAYAYVYVYVCIDATSRWARPWGLYLVVAVQNACALSACVHLVHVCTSCMCALVSACVHV